MKYLCILLIIMLATAGCASTVCIPVKVDRVVYSSSGTCNLLLENVSFQTLGNFGGFDCSDIMLGETVWVKFDGSLPQSPITQICQADSNGVYK
jgi:hypothetical protein